MTHEFTRETQRRLEALNQHSIQQIIDWLILCENNAMSEAQEALTMQGGILGAKPHLSDVTQLQATRAFLEAIAKHAG